jgi:hypothetical protein
MPLGSVTLTSHDQGTFEVADVDVGTLNLVLESRWDRTRRGFAAAMHSMGALRSAIVSFFSGALLRGRLAVACRSLRAGFRDACGTLRRRCSL